MGVIIKKCPVINAEIGICPLKTTYRKYCSNADSCNIRKTQKRNSQKKVNIVCHVKDCFNNFDEKCDTKCEIDIKGLCMIYQFSRERFDNSLKKSVESIKK